MTRSSDGSVTTTIANAHCDGGGETTAIGPVNDQGRAVASEAGDGVDARSLERFRQRHRRQNGSLPRQHRLARPWGPQEE